MSLRIKDIGEFGAINIIAEIAGGAMPDGIGDDCALLDLGGQCVAVTTDMISQEADIPEGMTPWQIGWYAVAINLSDLASKGAKPHSFLSSIALPPETDIDFLKSIYNGMKECCDRYGCRIVGGDTNSHFNLIICGTAIGTLKRGDFIGRRGAMEGDVIAVTGSLGMAALGLEIMLKHKGEREKHREAVNALLTPKPRIEEGLILAKEHLCTSAMDISDGLASSLHQLSKAGDVGFEIEFSALPIHPDIKNYAGSMDELERLVLYTGGEFELLMTMSTEAFEIARSAMDIKRIGRVTRGREVIIVVDENRRPLENRGYTHF